jgi:hypothetical protein
VSWVEEARQEALKKETSKSNVSSMEDPFVTIGFASVTEDAASHEDWRAGFALVTEGAVGQDDWSAVVVADAIDEAESLPVWETKVHSYVGGWNTSLAKREC